MESMDLLSEHGYRQDGRRADQIRNLKCTLGSSTSHADGVAYLEQGNTKVVAAVYGPHEAKYKSRLVEDRCLVNCQYSMATFSTTDRKFRPRGDRKSHEFNQLLQKTFEAAILTTVYPRSQIDIFCEILQADGGLLAACVNAAGLALVDAGVPLRGLPAACACSCVHASGDVDGGSAWRSVVDTCNSEEGGQSASLTVALLPKKDEVLLMELERRLHADHLPTLADAAIDACKQVAGIMETAVREHVARRAVEMSLEI